jgi:small conductance mechanosensitive channel
MLVLSSGKMLSLRYPYRITSLLVVCLFLLSALSAQVWAQVALPKPSSTPTDTMPVAPVKVNERTLFEVAGVTKEAAEQRADRINRRLQRLIEHPGDVLRFTEENTSINPTNDGYVIKLDNETILTVTQADVDYYLTPAPELAQTWSVKLVGGVMAGRIARTGTLGDIGMLTLTSLTDLIRSIIQWSPRLLGAILLAILFWGLAKLARKTAQWATSSKRLDPNMRQLAIALAFYSVWAMGLLAILSALGIDSVSIATTVGVSGFILGFAFKDILSHFFAGMMLLLERQFSIGGQIVVGDHEGTVERIDLRALQLRTYDNRLVTIPNGQVFNAAIVANSHNLYRRREFSITIGENIDARKAMQTAMEAVQSVDGVLPQPPSQVLASALAGGTLTLRILFFTSNTLINPQGVLSECILRVKEEIAKLEPAPEPTE